MATTKEEVQATAVTFRQAFGLQTEEQFRDWLRRESLSADSFHALMLRFTLVEKLERHYSSLIDEALPDMLRVDSARARTASGD